MSANQSREVSAIRRSLCTVIYGNDLGPRSLVHIVEVSVVERVCIRRFHCIH